VRAHRVAVAALAVAGLALIVPWAAGSGTHARSPAAARPAGYSIALPSSWKAVRGTTGRIDLRGPNGAAGVIWPVFVAGRLSQASATVTLRAFTRQRLVDGVRWEPPQAGATGLVSVRGKGAGRSAIALLRYAASDKGSAAVLYVAVAPQSAATTAETVLARIFASFTLTGAGGGTKAADASLRYTRWTDPKEGAFSLELPSGWKASGGLARYAAVDIRSGVSIVSPDENVSLLVGDSSVGTFIVPSQLLELGGFSEGSKYSPGYGVTMTVFRYLDGVDFASRYATTLAEANSCIGVKVLQARARPDTVVAMNAIGKRFGAVDISQQTDAGEVSFTCSIGKALISAYVFAGTQLTSTQSGALWQVPYLYVATARPGFMAQAEAVLRHAVASYRLDADWAARQQGVAVNVSKIVTATSSAISDSISSSYWHKVAVDDELSRQRSNTILGLRDTIDPDTGRSFKVESGSSYYWIDTQGRIAGTDVDAQPEVDFRRLVQLP